MVTYGDVADGCSPASEYEGSLASALSEGFQRELQRLRTRARGIVALGQRGRHVQEVEFEEAEPQFVTEAPNLKVLAAASQGIRSSLLRNPSS